MIPDLILASASPRRRELLGQTGLTFRIIPSEFDEDSATAVTPAALAEKLAHGKAHDIASRTESGIVIGADTIVVAGGQVLGKPRDDDDAARMLNMLSGGWHEVITGIAVIDAATGRELGGAETTRVKVRPLSQADVEAYVASGEPRDKAGAYAIQGLGSLFIERIEGCYANVVGLPIYRLARILKDFGVDPLQQSLSTTPQA